MYPYTSHPRVRAAPISLFKSDLIMIRGTMTLSALRKSSEMPLYSRANRQYQTSPRFKANVLEATSNSTSVLYKLQAERAHAPRPRLSPLHPLQLCHARLPHSPGLSNLSIHRTHPTAFHTSVGQHVRITVTPVVRRAFDVCPVA